MTERPDQFPVTQWTLIDRAVGGAESEAHQALSEWLQRYRGALVAYLSLARHFPGDTAEDLVQGFIHDKIMRGNLLDHARRERGKLRTFLRSALDRYVIDQYRKDHAAARSPGPGALVSLDTLPELPEPMTRPVSSTAWYDLVWVQTVLEETTRSVEATCRQSGREGHWRVFEARLIRPALQGEKPPTFDHLARTCGFASPVRAWNALVTVKRMFDQTLREVVREYAGDEASSVDDEINALFAILAEIDP